MFFCWKVLYSTQRGVEHVSRVFEMQWAEVPSMEVAKLARPISLAHGVVKEMTGWRLLKVRQRTGLAWFWLPIVQTLMDPIMNYLTLRCIAI